MKKIYIKEEFCMGCHLCEVYCQLRHSNSRDLIKAFKRELPRPLSRVRIEEKSPLYLSVRCQQCSESPCVYACLTGALSRDIQTGIVNVDEEKCIGCWTCLLVCPFSAIKKDSQQKIVIKCDLCQGDDIPMCVSNCPNEALVYVEVQDGT